MGDGKLSKGMFFETMSQVATLGYSGLSCDQRGYSPGAAPDDMAAYNYDILASDLFSLMDATNFSAPYGGKFHMVAQHQREEKGSSASHRCPSRTQTCFLMLCWGLLPTTMPKSPSSTCVCSSCRILLSLMASRFTT